VEQARRRSTGSNLSWHRAVDVDRENVVPPATQPQNVAPPVRVAATAPVAVSNTAPLPPPADIGLMAAAVNAAHSRDTALDDLLRTQKDSKKESEQLRGQLAQQSEQLKLLGERMAQLMELTAAQAAGDRRCTRLGP